METIGNQIMPKLCSKYACYVCHYYTCKKSSFDTHCLSHKHEINAKINQMETSGNQNMPKICSTVFTCKKCLKVFKNRSGIWKHNKICKSNNTTNLETSNLENKITNVTDKDDLINYLIKENQEFKNLILEIVKKDTYNSTTNNNNSHNKTFNLNLFLNETCKDAMNIMDFVDSIQLQLSDLENVGKLGYVEGITNIITKNLKALDVTQRPIHCTDKKREVLYIKDENKWEKEDDDKKKIRRAIKRVASKNHRLILKFKEAHPDCLKASSNYSDQYNKIIIESCGGSGDNDIEKEDKIIRNISKTVIIDKE